MDPVLPDSPQDATPFIRKESLWSRIWEVLGSFKYVLGGLAVVVLAGGLIASVTLSQHTQNIEQHASSGTPFEGQGIFDSCGTGCLDHLDMFAHAGFKVDLDYIIFGWTHMSSVLAFAQRAQQDNIKIIWSVKDLWTISSINPEYAAIAQDCGCNSPSALTKYLVDQVKDLPATWGYYIADEPKSTDYNAVAALSNIVHTEDPNHPRLIIKNDALYGNVGNVAGGLGQYAPLAEVLGEDYYPISYGQNINSTGAIASAVQTVVNSKGRQGAMVLEVNSGNIGNTNPAWVYATAYPSTSQMQSMLSQTMNNSTPRLVMWYHYIGTSSQQWMNLLSAQHPNTFYGTCGTNGEWACTTNTSLGVVQYTDSVPNDICSINATKANLTRGTAVYCCNGGTAQYGTCGSTGQYKCTTSCSSSNVEYTGHSVSSQCGINATKANLARGTAIACSCFGTNCPTSPTPTALPTSQPSPTDAPPSPTDVVPTAISPTPPDSEEPSPTGVYQPGPITLIPIPSGDVSPSQPAPSLSQHILGDLNNDGTVDIVDYQLLMACYGKSLVGVCISADLNNDGAVDGIDYNILIRAMLQQVGYNQN